MGASIFLKNSLLINRINYGEATPDIHGANLP